MTKKISLVATYNAENRQAAKALVSNPAVKNLHEVILVNEGDAQDISSTRLTSIRIANHAPHSEPLVMAVGAHYASGDVIVLCRNPGSVTERLCMQLQKARRHYSPAAGLHVFMKSDFPWRYDIETGFERGQSGRFINLEWEVVRNVAG
ncbi:hypothetical protein MXM41_00220 [Leclercia adecarboxylata]|uniref:hypothetical protein n=1 Tax=Leclercia adecarboxylata TaxID=83655 RepID=UPI002DBEAC88|nr:hypothetical protein [Leclercia adecarboxylata]MEB6377370.1 hypothetical protein [Leclercia adecarboxylata]